ncbi:unnamed protein product [Larinioides sclopetarius]|uniref:BESS domain-containing protein n=1 Tax=Larinioides sclopetarius TaxID=280406 RepID=A0AAV2BFR9_9ARAC
MKIFLFLGATYIYTGSSSGMELDTEGCSASTPQLPRQRVLNVQRKRKHSSLLDASTNLQSILKSLPNTAAEDEYDAFGRIIAMGLRKLPPEVALAAQSELLAVHTKYQLKCLKPPQVQSPTDLGQQDKLAFLVQTTLFE